jgi:hypothetical protein
MRNHSAERIFEKKTQKRTRRRIPRSSHRICGSIANYETPGRIPFAVCVSGIWASLLAGKRHRRRMARSYCPMATLVLADDRCTYLGLVVGTPG